MSGARQESSTLRNADDSLGVTTSAGSNDVANELPSQRLPMEDRLAGKMFLYGREIICFFLAFTFTALAALHSSGPKISKPPSAKPFFNQSSIVPDFYKGHLGAMVDRTMEADYSFIMYYAPWDAECQAVRQEFEKVAHYYRSQVSFAAINCWHPGSECRAQLSKIFSYPVLMLYPSKDSGVAYEGINTAPYMIRFIRAAMNPIRRVTRKEHINCLLNENDAVVVGFFNFTGLANSPGYKEFYKAAMRFLEKDPNRELMFAAVTNTGSNVLNVDIVKFPSIRLLTWNESLSYPEEKEWTTANIINWVSDAIDQPATWLQPPGYKALTLSPYVGEGPGLILFTPRNPFHDENYNYNLLREIGTLYSNCDGNRSVSGFALDLGNFRRSAVERHSEKTRRCSEILKRSDTFSVSPCKSAIDVCTQQWINESCCENIVVNKCLTRKGKRSDLTDSTTVTSWERQKRFCVSRDVFNVFRDSTNQRDDHRRCCPTNDIVAHLREDLPSASPEGTVWPTAIDPRSPHSVRESQLREDCRKWLTGNKYHPPVFPHDSREQSEVQLTSSVCKTNRTLGLVAIDSLHFFHFAEALGIDVLRKPGKTAVVILDPAEESQYVLQEEFNRRTLIQFINNYTDGLLQRSLRSENARRFVERSKRQDVCDHTHGQICIRDLTTETFLDVVLQPAKDVIVMYHSPYCAFCSAVAYTYLTVAHYLSRMDHLSFARIDGDNNDLPWEYTMNRFPSILFFPAKRKADSTVFPFSLPMTVSNLINYILANLEVESRVEALTNICWMGSGELPDKCVTRIRYLCMDIIEQLLKEYRKLARHYSFTDNRMFGRRRKIILVKINHIRDIRLILGSTDNLTKNVAKVWLIRRKFRRYYSAIRSLRSASTAYKQRRARRLNDTRDILKQEIARDEL